MHLTETNVLKSIVDTNLFGTLLGCKVALNAMIPQEKECHIFNMDGAGANGMVTENFAAYGATKAAIPQLTKTLTKETKHSKVGVHTLSPGMVITDLLMAGNKEKRALKIFNILAEQPETCAKWLVPRIRGVSGKGKYIAFLDMPTVLWRFLTAWRRRSRFFKVE